MNANDISRSIRKTRTLARMLLGKLNSEIDVPPGMLSALQDSGFVLIPHAVASVDTQNRPLLDT